MVNDLLFTVQVTFISRLRGKHYGNFQPTQTLWAQEILLGPKKSLNLCSGVFLFRSSKWGIVHDFTLQAFLILGQQIKWHGINGATALEAAGNRFQELPKYDVSQRCPRSFPFRESNYPEGTLKPEKCLWTGSGTKGVAWFGAALKHPHSRGDKGLAAPMPEGDLGRGTPPAAEGQRSKTTEWLWQTNSKHRSQMEEKQVAHWGRLGQWGPKVAAGSCPSTRTAEQPAKRPKWVSWPVAAGRKIEQQKGHTPCGIWSSPCCSQIKDPSAALWGPRKAQKMWG